MKKTVVLIALALCLAAFNGGQSWAAFPPAQDQNKCLISSPGGGSQISGQVVITGTATHSDFRWYQVGYAPDPNPAGTWKFFASGETAVPSGRLGVWDTTQIPDGTYQLILEVHRNDGNNDHCVVGQLRVNNTVQTPTPTSTVAPLPTAAQTPTALPSTTTTTEAPTVVIEQPPTATPRPTPTYSSVDNPTPTPEMTRFKLPIELGSVRNASCRGAEIALLAFAAIALYFIVRNLAASGVRKLSKTQKVDGFHTRRPREY